MGTRQTKNNSKQDAQKGKSESNGKTERRKQGKQGSAAGSGNDALSKSRK